MPRFARLVVPNYPHHVTQRGSRRQLTFFNDADYSAYCDLLAEQLPKAEVDILAYCLMPNHVHLILVPHRGDSLARLLRRAHACYARRINVKYGWQGHLWQERFHSFVMDEEHLLAAARYVDNWHTFLADALSATEIEKLRSHSRSGHPAGNLRFIGELESLTGRRLVPRKRGPTGT